MIIERTRITDRASWLAMRTQDLTASDVGAAVGVDPYKSALKLYGEKTGQLMADPDTPLMRRGRWLEPAVIEAMADENPDWVIERPKLYLRAPELRLGATPDALADLGDGGGICNIQCKVVSRLSFARHWQDGPPMHYVLQTLTEGLLLDAARSKIAALVIDAYSADLYLFDVERHAGAEAKVQEIAIEFWKRVAERRPPPADYGQDAEVIDKLYPAPVPEKVLDLTGNNRLAAVLPEYVTLKTGMAIDKKRLAELEAEIKETLGDAERATLPGFDITWKLQHRKEHTVKATSFRPLRVTDLSDDEEEQAA